jgi:hypothetical protein
MAISPILTLANAHSNNLRSSGRQTKVVASARQTRIYGDAMRNAWNRKERSNAEEKLRHTPVPRGKLENALRQGEERKRRLENERRLVESEKMKKGKEMRPSTVQEKKQNGDEEKKKGLGSELKRTRGAETTLAGMKRKSLAGERRKGNVEKMRTSGNTRDSIMTAVAEERVPKVPPAKMTKVQAAVRQPKGSSFASAGTNTRKHGLDLWLKPSQSYDSKKFLGQFYRPESASSPVCLLPISSSVSTKSPFGPSFFPRSTSNLCHRKPGFERNSCISTRTNACSGSRTSRMKRRSK